MGRGLIDRREEREERGVDRIGEESRSEGAEKKG